MTSKKKSKVEESTIISSKVWTITINTDSDGVQTMKRVNDGFNPMELLGIIDFVKDDIMAQVRGKIKPDVVERTIVKD